MLKLRKAQRAHVVRELESPTGAFQELHVISVTISNLKCPNLKAAIASHLAWTNAERHTSIALLCPPAHQDRVEQIKCSKLPSSMDMVPSPADPCDVGSFPLLSDMVGVCISFSDGRTLAQFEQCSKATRRMVVEDHLHLYKVLLIRQLGHAGEVAALPIEDGKRALMAWDSGDFQPVRARESTVAPTPRYLHRVALAADGWYYLFGGHLQESMAGDVWRFRAQEPKNPGYNRDARLKVVWEQVDGVALAPAGAGAANDDEEESESSSDDSGFGNTDSERGTGVDENENRAAGDAADHPATIEPQPNAPQGPGQIPAMAAGAGAAGNQGAPGGVPVIPPHLDDDLQQQRPRPRPRCAVSWTCAPGSNKIFLFGGLGSDGNFLCDLWCFHAGGRGECRWEELQSVRDDGKAAEEEPGDSPLEPPEARWGHTMVEHGGLMYMFGGSSPGHAFGKLWRLDTSAWPCVWSLVRPSGDLPPKRGGHAATVVGDTLYIFGGHIVRDTYNDLWAIDLPACSKWRMIPQKPDFPLPRIGHCAVALGSRILIFGGRDFEKDEYTAGIECFETKTESFRRFPHALGFASRSRSMGGMWYGFRMTGHSAVPCSRGLLIVGGLVPCSVPGGIPTMSSWVLDVFKGRSRLVKKKREKQSGRRPGAGACGTS